MAAATEAEYGLGDNEAKSVDIEGGKRAKIGSGVVTEESEGAGKNGSVEGGEQEEVQVAKKARVEKAENGGTEGVEESGYGLDSFEGEEEKEDAEVLNGTVETEDGEGEGEGEGEGDEEEEEEDEDEEEEEVSDGVGDGDDEGIDEVGASGKDAPGDVGLRTLLQEGESKNGSVAKLGADASRMMNGAK